MSKQSKITRRTNAVDRVVHVFPKADPRRVATLTPHPEALTRYLATDNHLTHDEVAEQLAAFVPGGISSVRLRATG